MPIFPTQMMPEKSNVKKRKVKKKIVKENHNLLNVIIDFSLYSRLIISNI
jgi:hypothetical protein